MLTPVGFCRQGVSTATRTGGPSLAIELLGHDAVLIERHTMQRQAQLTRSGLDAGRGQRLDQHRFARRTQAQHGGKHTLLCTGTEQDLPRRQLQPATLQPAADRDAPALQRRGRG